MLYAPPPLLPVATHALCISKLAGCPFLGNIGLIDLDNMEPGIASKFCTTLLM